MFTIKACHLDGPVWVGGVREIHTVHTEPAGTSAWDWISTPIGKAVLDRTGEVGFRNTGEVPADCGWTLLRVVTEADGAYNLIVPSDLTFIMNDVGVTIDRI